jgi:hypothetical protein
MTIFKYYRMNSETLTTITIPNQPATALTVGMTVVDANGKYYSVSSQVWNETDTWLITDTYLDPSPFITGGA